jgi:hypothetical protein
VSFPWPAVCRGLGGELAGLDEVNEGGPGHLDDFGDRRLGHCLLQQQSDFRLLTIKLRLAQRSFRAAEQSALGSGGSETLFGPFGDQVGLDFGEQTEQGDHYLGLQVFLAPEADTLFDGDEENPLPHQFIDDLDDLAQAAAQARQLALAQQK